MRIAILFIFLLSSFFGQSQCPEISSTTTNPNCIPDCDRCGGDKITINLQGGDLPNNGKIDYYADINPGFNPYLGQGVKIGSANIVTNNPKCRICPQLLGFMIDACGTEAANEFLIMWSGSGLNTSDFNFDYASQNNTGGAGNADIGAGGCSITTGPAGLVGGCNAISVGANFNLPANSIWIVFTSSNASTNYDFSAICGLSCKIYVSSSTCSRTIGAFSNFDASVGNRTQVMTTTGCACSTVATYDVPGSLTGNGDFWEGGNISNSGCAVPSLSTPSYTPATSVIDPFSYTIPQTWCDKDYEIVGIPNPVPDPDCCMEIYTERITVHVKCPLANATSIEACETANGLALFNLEDADANVLGSSGGTVEYYRDMAGTQLIFSPYLSGNATIYARILDGNCKSNLVQIQLKVRLLPVAKSTNDRQCDDGTGFATFDLSKLENTIKNGNASATVKFFLDINKNQEIQSPFQTSTVTIYACINDGLCESKPVAIQLTVQPKPKAYEANAKACPGADGTAIFNLTNLIPKITNNQSSLSVKFYEDEFLIKQISSPYKTKSDTLYAVASDGICFSDPVAIILSLVELNSVLLLSDKACDDGMGNAAFNLIGASRYLQQGDTSIKVSWYGDSTLMDSLIPPVIVNGIDTIYAILKKDSCISLPIPMILESVKRPSAYGVELFLCSDSIGFAHYDLNQLIDSINGRSGKSVIFASDSLLRSVIGRNYIGSGDTLYAVVLDGTCNSITVSIVIHVQPSAQFNFPKDTIVCNELILPLLTGDFLSPNAHYEDMNGNIWMPGDTITKSQTLLLVDQKGTCFTVDSFHITVIQKPNAGNDFQTSVCEGSLVNLSNLLSGADIGGIFLDTDQSGALSDSLVNSNGLAGKSFNFSYVLNGNSYCIGDTANLLIKIVKKLSAGQPATIILCENESVDLTMVLQNADSGGNFRDPAQSGALQFGKWYGNLSGPGNFNVYYVIGDGITCPLDSALINLEVLQKIDISSPGNQQVCNYYVLPAIIGKNISNKAAYFDNPNGMGKSHFPGDTIFSSTILFIYDMATGYCHDEKSFTVQIVNDKRFTYIQNGLCPGDSLQVGQEIFSIQKTNGTVVLKQAAVGGCDSIVTVQLQFHTIADSALNIQICSTKTIQIHQQIFSLAKPTGSIILPNGSHTGCDSLIQVNLNLVNPPPPQLIRNNICAGDTLVVNGKAYYEGKLTGVDTLLSNDPLFCDSLLDIQLQLLRPGKYTFNATICETDSIQIGNIYFNKKFSSLQDTLIKMASNGCDSIRNIQIDFYSPATFTLLDTLCEGEFLEINGNRYDRNHSNGQETLHASSQHGCDSLLNIQLLFKQVIFSSYQTSLCESDSVLINGKYYSKLRLSGIDTLFQQANGGCDSIVQVAISLMKDVNFRLDTLICENQSLVIHQHVYDLSKPTGIELFPSGASTGCDSILTVQLKFNPTSQFYFKDTLCVNESVTINGIVYNQNNTSGKHTITNHLGCDSTVYVDLHFNQLDVTYPKEITIAPGQSRGIQLVPNFNPSSILWTPSEGLSCNQCLKPDINPSKDTEYQITLTDDQGCQLTIYITVRVFADNKVFVPNVFSPNGDNLNDLFKIFSENGQIQIKQFEIFDRWGNQIFHQENKMIQDFSGWNGNALNGDKMNPGVYIYSILLEIPGSGERKLYGDISLIR